jgi:hypothetical protein
MPYNISYIIYRPYMRVPALYGTALPITDTSVILAKRCACDALLDFSPFRGPRAARSKWPVSANGPFRCANIPFEGVYEFCELYLYTADCKYTGIYIIVYRIPV